MSKDVMISIQSLQNLDGRDEEGPELITQGSYDYAADGIRFSYMESELTGLDGTRTTFQVFPEEVILSRQGAVNAQMVFHRGEKRAFQYRTQLGTLRMCLNTHRLECGLDAWGGSLEIEYDLNFDQAFLSRNKFIIHVALLDNGQADQEKTPEEEERKL